MGATSTSPSVDPAHLAQENGHIAKTSMVILDLHPHLDFDGDVELDSIVDLDLAR